ncbi:gamma-glutamyltransferase family protein [Acetobacter sp. AN02]|nr:gamma-glutamyltransferase family protein [Acetobacter sp. AN02]
MVTAPHHLAAQAGLDVLKDGGCAIEAAVTVAATLAVVYPHMTSVGGDSFWLICRPDGTVRSIDACGRAGSLATPDWYRSQDMTTIPWRGGAAANTVAGTVSGWEKALSLRPESRTRLTRERLLRDAIWYADNGVAVTRSGAEIAVEKGEGLRAAPGYAAVFEPAGRPLQTGEILKNPALAGTFRRLASNGFRSFYDGAVAKDIAQDLAAAGSPVTEEDLARQEAELREPLSVTVRDARLFNMGPPTQGIASLLILALFDRLVVTSGESFAHIHGLVEATKKAFRYRDAHVGDPAWMTEDCQALLSSPEALDAMARDIRPDRAAPWPHRSQLGDTVWFGVTDAAGCSVSMIQSTYFEFGSGVVLPQTGIVWQNRGASFRIAERGWNILSPGRKPFHTLNPAAALFSDGRRMVYGTMGGEGQPQTQAALFTRYARFGMELQEAITAPRWLLGRTWGEETTTLKYEDRFDPALITALADAGHAVERVAPFTSLTGHAGALVRHPGGLIEGATDPRSDGGVAAW